MLMTTVNRKLNLNNMDVSTEEKNIPQINGPFTNLD